MTVSENVKTAYMEDGKTKYLRVSFPELGLVFTSGSFEEESLRLKEMMISKDTVEFVGCISIFFRINISGVQEDIKGQKITAEMYTEGTEEEPIPLFCGYVDTPKNTSNRGVMEITAYDALNTAADKDLSEWWQELEFPMTLKEIRDSLFEALEIEQENVALPQDGFTLREKADMKEVNGLAMVKKICLLNGACGIINRLGIFEYRYLKEAINPETEEDVQTIRKYQSVKYEDFKVKKITKVTIKTGKDDIGISYGSGKNVYVINENVLTLGLDETTLERMAENILEKVGGFSFMPFTAKNNGLPFLEVGKDIVRYRILNQDMQTYSRKVFPILNRELTGIQALKDTYTAKGKEDQRVFTTDLQSQIDKLQDEANNVMKFELVDEEPEQWDSNTVYFVRKN